MATRPRPAARRIAPPAGPLTIPSASPFTEQGVVGTVVYSGFVRSVERSAKWSGMQKYETIADMAVNTSIIAAGVRYTAGLISHPQWSVRPAIEGDAEAEAAAELVESIIGDMVVPWSHVVRRAYMYKFYGFGLQEWTAKRRPDGKVGLLTIAPRPQFTVERWEVDDAGMVAGVWQRSPKSALPVGIPRSKLLYLVDDILSDSPEGVGIFRHLAEPWERLKMYLDLEARAFERDLRGIPIGRIPYTLINQAVTAGQIKKEDAATMVKAMEDFVQLAVKKSDTGLTIDSAPYISQAADGDKVTGTMQWGLELLQGSGGGMAEIAAAVKRTQFEMATVMCVQQLLYGMEGASGNRALSQDMSQNLYLMANASLSDIAAAVDSDIIKPICLLNNIPDNKRPYCAPEDVAFKDAESVAKTLADMAQAGAVLAPDDPVIKDVRGLMGVSAPSPISPEMLGMSDSVDGEEDAGDVIDDAQPEDDPVEKRGGFNSAKHPRAPKGSDAGGQFTSGGIDTQSAKTGPGGWSVATIYHGSGAELEQFNDKTPVYLTGSADEAGSFAQGAHLGGTSGVARVYSINFKPGRTQNIDSALNRVLDEGGDLDTEIGRQIKALKGGKTRYLSFTHPGLHGGDFKATISLYPKSDLRIVSSERVRKEAPRTLYVHRPLLNGAAIQAWAKAQGIKSTLDPADMHVTVAFSKEPVDWSRLTPSPYSMTVLQPADRALHQFPPRTTPNGAVVLKFGSAQLMRRWQELRDAGASWDFPEYQPHITLTYAVASADLSGLAAYTGPLVLGPEIFGEVNEGWGNDIIEVPTGA